MNKYDLTVDPNESEGHMSVPAANTQKKSAMPTRKWWAAAVGSLASILAHFAATDFTFGDTEESMIITALSALVLAYFKSNDDTPGGVPTNTNAR